MNRYYYLSNCDTCKRIIKYLELPESVTLVDIKHEPLTGDTLEILHALVGSYEALFSKRAQLYKQRNLKEQTLGEADFKSLLLEHYTFLKRPVLVYQKKIFVGNSKKIVEAAKAWIHEK